MGDLELRLRQRAVIEFLTAEGETPVRIHERLKKIYEDTAVDVSTVRRWVRRCEEAEGQLPLGDAQRSGRPTCAVTPQNIRRVDEIILANRRVTMVQLCSMLSIGKGSVRAIIEKLGYSKICSQWVPTKLTGSDKEARKKIATDLLHRYEMEGEKFLSNIVTGDEIWVNCYEPEPKRHRSKSPKKQKIKRAQSAGKIVVVFWDEEGVILLDVLEHETTTDPYIETLERLTTCLKQVRPSKNEADVLLLHNSGRPSTNIYITEQCTKFGWTVLPHPPYSPDLAPSDFHLFGPLKEALSGYDVTNNETLKNYINQWLSEKDSNFYRAGIRALVKRWIQTVQNEGGYIEKMKMKLENDLHIAVPEETCIKQEAEEDSMEATKVVENETFWIKEEPQLEEEKVTVEEQSILGN